MAEARLAAWAEDLFCPRHRVRVNVHGYRREVARPLFPGYLFASFDASSFLRAVHYAHGVRGVVRSGTEPAEVPAELLDAIRARMRDGYVVLDPPRFHPGERVEVVEGPLRGCTGIFERNLSAERRVAILLDLLGRDAKVIVRPDALRPAS